MVFTKNRDRLLEAEGAKEFLARVVAQAREKGWTSDEHFSVDGETLFVRVGFGAAKTDTASLRTKSSHGAEMAGGRIPGHSRVGTAIPGANPLVGRDGITLRPSSGAILRTTRPNTGCLGGLGSVSDAT